ncbi:MAG TPA: transglycosylase SLT domain-containing protein, partial [Candidatus Moranbacteria bacterium]|nr:transglycosylase SLT domain-containing protein [Candidatus Moranbacteria bacterium]
MLEGKSSNSEPNRWRSNSPQGRRLAAVEKSKKKDQLMSRRKFLGTALLGVAALSLKKFMDSADWVLDNREVEQGKSSEDETMSEEEKLRAALEGVKERVLTREQEEAIEKEVVEGTIKEQLIVNKQVDIEKAKAAIYKKWYKLYSPGGVEHPGLLESLSDMQPWLSELEEVFRRQQVPETLIYLAIPESNFVFRRVSPAGACGPYQFMRNTAKGYNLRCDDIIDERFDPIKSAEAAASYLLDLYNQFGGEWKLALAAYNGGYANKYRVAKGSNTEEMSYSDYLKYREKNINDYINENEEQGFYLHEVERGETLSSLARRYKITVEEIRQKNKKMVDAKTT